MDRAIAGELIVGALFLIAWLFPIVVILGYYRRVVPYRRKEIEATYLRGRLSRSFKDHPAALFLTAGSSPGDVVRKEFNRIQAPERYYVPVALLVVISALGLLLCYAWVHERWFEAQAATPTSFPATMSLAVVMALAGAYVWGIWEILQRVGDCSLTPSEIWEVCFRWLVAIPIGYAFSLIAFDEAQPAFAFAASAFPFKSVHRYMRESTLKKLGFEPERASAAQQRVHVAIEGISDAMAIRLEELMVYTTLDMAYANPVRIMIKTGVPILEVLDWMDQALFRVYAAKHRKAFLACGIRTSIEVCEFVNLHCKGDNPSDTCAADLAKKLGMPVEAMKNFLFRIALDPQVKALYHLWYPDGAPKELGGDQDSKDEENKDETQ
jgi:hypothetical protein